jgi:hypothetical protein
MALLTGFSAPSERAELYNGSGSIIAEAQPLTAALPKVYMTKEISPER